MSRPQPLTEDECALVLTWSREAVPLREQARRLDRPVTNLVATVRRYQAAGLLPKRGTAPGPAWTAGEISRLHALIDAGYSYAAIARKLKRTETAVRIKAKRINCRLLHSRAALTCRQIADLLGLNCAKTATRWISTYGLRARNAGTEAKPLWRVQWEDLLEWLETPTHWMAYHPTRVTDPLLREHLTEIRQGQPGWLSVGEVARRLAVGIGAVGSYIQFGALPATRYGNWWVREDDLAAFVPPHVRPLGLRVSRPVVTPAAVWPSVRELAATLGCTCKELLPYLRKDGSHWALRPLDEAAYQAGKQECESCGTARPDEPLDALARCVAGLATGHRERHALSERQETAPMDAPTTLTVEDVIARLRAAIAVAGDQQTWARAHAISPAYLSDVLHGRREPGPSVLIALRLRRVVRYASLGEDAPCIEDRP